MSGLSVEDIRDWKESEVTIEFFKLVHELLEDSDRQVHKYLEQGDLNQSAYYNAGMVQLEEVLDIPEIMKHNLKGEEGDAT